jgi:CheY-like chemotaxis protein
MAETKTILLADDSVTIQKVVELTFMDENFQVSSVGNGAEAMAWLGERTPDVVIADVHMPGADGYEVCRRSKELHPTVPVLLLVGTFEAFDGDAAARAGADGHLKKPFDSQELLRRVRELSTSSRVASPSAPAAAAMPELPPLAPAALELEDQMWEPLPDEPAVLSDLPDFDVPSPTPPTLEPAATAFVPIQAALPAAEPASSYRAYEPVASFTPASAAPAPAAAPAAAASGPLSDADVDRIARRVIELLGDKPVRDVAWEVVPDLAEVLLKSRIRELEASVE